MAELNIKRSNENIRQVTRDDSSDKQSSSILATYLNMFKATLGTGILSMPMAIKNMGVYFGSGILLVVGIMIMWCGVVLIKNIRKISTVEKNPKITFADGMRLTLEQGPHQLRVLAPSAPIVINTFNITCQFLTLGSYVLFMANVSKHLCDHYWTSFDIRFHVLIIFFPLLIVNAVLRDLRLLGYFSLIGNLCQLVGIVISYYYLYGGFQNFDQLVKVASWYDILQGFGIAVYSYTSAGVILSLAHNMEKPEWFIKPCGVLNSGTTFTILLYISTGVIGYAKFGDNTAGTFIRNFPNEPLASVAVLAFGLGVFLGFFIHIYPIIEIILNWYKNRSDEVVPERKLKTIDISARSILLALGAVFVVVFTEINLILGLIGSACMCSLNIIFPCILEFIMAGIEEPKGKSRKIIAGSIGLASTIFCFMGVAICIIQMCIQAFSSR